MNKALLQTKFYVPNMPRGFVNRSPLYKKMDLVLEKKLCIISTPAGYGKTTLIVSWAKQRKQPLAWISLDERDNSFQSFFAYIVTAIQGVANDFGGELLERLVSPQSIPHELFLTLIVNQLNLISLDCVIVLDDYHNITEKEIHEALEYLLDNLPQKIHFVISSRTEPLISLANLRAKGQLLEIRYSDLCFSKDDAGQYLNKTMGLNLHEDEVQELVDHTEGWIVGLHLAAIALASTDKTSAFLGKLNIANRYIAEYLFDEVLRLQPVDLQEFLLQSSVMSRFSTDLCNYVLQIQSSQELIGKAERSNLFITQLDTQQEWYRYHPLFSELLYARLKKNRPAVIREIEQRASIWFEKEGLLEDAIEYAIKANDYLNAASLIEFFGKTTIWTGGVGKLLNWLEAFPEEVYYEYPILWTLHLWSHINLAQFSIAANELEKNRFENIYNHIHDETKKNHFKSSVATIQALISINRKYDIPEGLRYAESGLDSLDENDESSVMAPLIYGKACMLEGDLSQAKKLLDQCAILVEKTKGPFMKMIITHHQSELAFFRGDLREAETLLNEGYKVGIEHHMDDSSAFFRINIDLGRVLYEKDNLVAAHQLLTAGVQGCERYLIAYDILDGYCSLFDLALMEKNLRAAEQTILRVEYLAKNSGFPQPIMNRVDSMMTRLDISKNDWRSVRYWLDKRDVSNQTIFEFYERYEAHTTIQALMAIKELERANILIRKLLAAAEENRWLMEAAYYHAWLSVNLYEQGNLQSALSTLKECVTIAMYQRYVRTVMDVEGPILDLLHKLQDELIYDKEQGKLGAYIQKLIDSCGTSSSSTGHSWLGTKLSDSLTDREIKVLELLAKGHANQKIAEIMVVSQSTVKFHLKNIYLKLGVHTRTQAIARGEELRLI
ncbi:MAG: LuxR C-terminal-related transcriptional regulator [Anaerolineales bacterium]|jgi:LuxR family maltose regulon positive regulatory protein